MTFPTTARFSATVLIPCCSDSTAGTFQGFLTSSGDQVVGPSVQAANTDYVAIVEGIVRVSQAGNIQLVFGSEVSGTTVILRQGTVGQLPIAA